MAMIVAIDPPKATISFVLKLCQGDELLHPLSNIQLTQTTFVDA